MTVVPPPPFDPQPIKDYLIESFLTVNHSMERQSPSFLRFFVILLRFLRPQNEGHKTWIVDRFQYYSSYVDKMWKKCINLFKCYSKPPFLEIDCILEVIADATNRLFGYEYLSRFLNRQLIIRWFDYRKQIQSQSHGEPRRLTYGCALRVLCVVNEIHWLECDVKTYHWNK